MLRFLQRSASTTGLLKKQSTHFATATEQFRPNHAGLNQYQATSYINYQDLALQGHKCATSALATSSGNFKNVPKQH